MALFNRLWRIWPICSSALPDGGIRINLLNAYYSFTHWKFISCLPIKHSIKSQRYKCSRFLPKTQHQVGKGRHRNNKLENSFFFFFFFFFWPCHVACRILVPGPGFEPTPPALGVWSPNHWATREVPKNSFLWTYKSNTMEKNSWTCSLNGKAL